MSQKLGTNTTLRINAPLNIRLALRLMGLCGGFGRCCLNKLEHARPFSLFDPWAWGTGGHLPDDEQTKRPVRGDNRTGHAIPHGAGWALAPRTGSRWGGNAAPISICPRWPRNVQHARIYFAVAGVRRRYCAGTAMLTIFSFSRRRIRPAT